MNIKVIPVVTSRNGTNDKFKTTIEALQRGRWEAYVMGTGSKIMVANHERDDVTPNFQNASTLVVMETPLQGTYPVSKVLVTSRYVFPLEKQFSVNGLPILFTQWPTFIAFK
jgi:hypothetical protein